MATYLITQATGQQSQWVIEHLLAAGAKVHAVVRNPDKVPAILHRDGVKIFKGDSVNFDEIFNAAQGCKAVFLNTFPYPFGLEEQQAKTVAEACKKAGVESIVASTTMHTGDKKMWDDEVTKQVGLHNYYISKTAIEDAVRAAGFKAYTVVRPAFIHFDFYQPSVQGNYPELAANAELVHSFNEGVRFPYIDASDIGKYAAAALQDSAKFGGQEIELIGDYLSAEEIHDRLVRVTGRSITVRKRTPEQMEAAKTTNYFQPWSLWANQKDLSGAVQVSKEVEAKFGIPFTSIENAFKRDKNRLLECIPARA